MLLRIENDILLTCAKNSRNPPPAPHSQQGINRTPSGTQSRRVKNTRSFDEVASARNLFFVSLVISTFTIMTISTTTSAWSAPPIPEGTGETPFSANE